MIQFFTKKLRNKKGFTLVELLIVIALLGILAGIAIPRMTGLTEGAKKSADQATVQTLMRDTQVAIVSGQLSTEAIVATLITDDKVKGTYFDGYVMPTSQTSEAAYTIKIYLQKADTNLYNIEISDNGTTPVVTTGVAEAIK